MPKLTFSMLTITLPCGCLLRLYATPRFQRQKSGLWSFRPPTGQWEVQCCEDCDAGGPPARRASIRELRKRYEEMN